MGKYPWNLNKPVEMKLKNPLDRLIKALKKLPGVGEKTATRFAFYFLNASNEEIQQLLSSIHDVKQNLRLCSICFNLTNVDPCSICTNTKRDTSQICVVENPIDLITIEKAGYFRGVYHVLQGTLSPLDAIGPSDIRISELLERVNSGDIKEVVLALNPTVEGEATIAFIRSKLEKQKVKVSRIAYGIPVGGSVEYTDPLTLSRALDNRKQI
jgi:recombination protein RecR